MCNHWEGRKIISSFSTDWQNLVIGLNFTLVQRWPQQLSLTMKVRAEDRQWQIFVYEVCFVVVKLWWSHGISQQTCPGRGEEGLILFHVFQPRFIQMCLFAKSLFNWVIKIYWVCFESMLQRVFKWSLVTCLCGEWINLRKNKAFLNLIMLEALKEPWPHLGKYLPSQETVTWHC